MECFDSTTRTVRVTDIALRVGVDKGTASRLLTQLSDAGFLERVADGYRLGWRIGELAAIRSATVDASGVIASAVADLAAETTSTVQCAVYNPDIHKAVITCAAESSRPIRVAASLGGVLPLHATAAGRAILLALSDAEVSDALSACDWKRYTERTITDQESLMMAISKSKESGYAIVHGELFSEQCSIAAPITVADGKVYGSLAALVIPSDLDPEGRQARLAAAVLSASKTLGRNLGTLEKVRSKR